MSRPCPRLNQLKENFYATSPLIKNVCAEYRDMFTFIEKYSGLNLTHCQNETTIHNILSLQDVLSTEVSVIYSNCCFHFDLSGADSDHLKRKFFQTQMNLKLPDWTKSVFPEPLNSLLILLAGVEVEDPRIFRLSAGWA